jgi:hypothetical protein
VGNTKAFNYFKNNYTDALQHEQGWQGNFYLHPIQNGVARLGELLGKANLQGFV